MAMRSLADLREEMRAVTRGERQASPLPVTAMLATLSSPENLELLRIINTERPATMSKLVELTGCAQPNVLWALQQLALHGLVRLEREGREVRPVPIVARIDIDTVRGTYERCHCPRWPSRARAPRWNRCSRRAACRRYTR
jgi:predicted transcriptional regulator